MARFPSLPDEPQLLDVFRRFPDGLLPLLEYHDAVLRAPSPLTIGQRELIAAYVSAVNACKYCIGAHTVIAQIHDVSADVLESALHDPNGGLVEPPMRALLAFVRKLTETPSRMSDADAEGVYAAGWDETALFHAIRICALFNFMNRIVEGCGVTATDRTMAGVLERHRAKKDDPQSYRSLAEQLGM